MPSTGALLKYIYGLEKLGIKKGLGRIEALTNCLGKPQRFYPCIHVAGTNGKGSVCAMIASVLTKAGYKTGLYTSPHLDKFNERISISGRLIADAQLLRAAAPVKGALDELIKSGKIDEPSFFEFTTALALVHFKLMKVDAAVIETGMGGRWDATNVVTPLVSVITNIGMDHSAILGGSLEAIAREKAGIIKPGVPVVTAETKSGPLGVIRGVAKRRRARLFRINTDFSIQRPNLEKMTFDFNGIRTNHKNLKLSLYGAHQFQNAAIALAAIELLRERGFKISKSAVAKGLIEASWPGRFEVVLKKPYVIIDSAHNPAGALVLKKALIEKKRGRLVLILGIMQDKDIAGIVKTLAPVADAIIATQADIERAEGAEKLKCEILKHAKSKTVLSAEKVKGACKAAQKLARPGDTICVAGSIYTAAEARKYLIKRRKQR